MSASEIVLNSVPILIILAVIFAKVAVDKNWKITEYF